ncbi:related to Pectinesterase A [Phialocephala subalpina]|uniref:Pectinesterase n=1 Tax=Phialocephala subalpina TaxID=576137 RepID=A0A1L7XNS5_9HELO|nr:related to Pectinesterase A [Phialocephala subalpina]
MLLNHLHSFLLLPSLVALGQSLAIQKGQRALQAQAAVSSSAVAALGSGSDDACIFIYAGTYEEQVSIEYEGNLTIYGYTSDTSSYSSNEVTISSSQSSAEAGTLDDSSAVNFASDGINIYNINFENTFGTASQAVAVTANGDSQGFYGCQFIGWQDTLYSKAGNQYYKSCYIEGATDFIFGDAAAWFDSCDIAAKKAGAAITANSRTLSTDDAWYVFDSCNVDAASGYSLEGEVYLGRPWRVLARVMFQSSVLSNIINAAGWTTMADNATPVFEEFNNSGDGSDTSDREYTTTATAAVTQSELWGDASWIDATY